MTNEKLTERFLSMKWDESHLPFIQFNKDVTQDNIISVLDNTFSDWSTTVDTVALDGGNKCVSVTLYLPGRIIGGTGSNEWDALVNIINKLTQNVNRVSNNSEITPQNTTEQPKTTTQSVMAQLSAIKSQTQQNAPEQPKNDAQAIF